MKRGWLVFIAVWLFGSTVWAQAPYQWSKVRVGGNGENVTLANGTNDAGWIVGIWRGFADPFDPGGAFRFSQGKFLEFTVPGAEEMLQAEAVAISGVRVNPEDIGKSSTIVGTYVIDYESLEGGGEGELHAFLYRHGLADHILIDYPGAFWTFPFAVNDKRQVTLGFFEEYPQNEVKWGAAIYDYATNTFTPVKVFEDVVGAETDVVIEGINNKMDLTGTVAVPVDDGCGCNFVHFGFVRIAGKDHLLEPPEWAQWFKPEAINDKRVVVGVALTNEGHFVGFRHDTAKGTWEEIRHPEVSDGSWDVTITDIDNLGRMTAVVQRVSDGYASSWWVRPKK